MTGTLKRTAEQVNDYYEWATNASDIMAGRADAVRHTGQLLEGTYDADQLATIQEEVLNDSTYGYRKGYGDAWNAVAGILSGVSIDEIHKL